MHWNPAAGPSGAAPLQSSKTPFRRNGVVRAGAGAYSAPIEAGRTIMKSKTRLLILALAVAVNGAAFGALHVAMVDVAERAVLANQEFDHVVVSATRAPADIAKMCPGTKAL